MPSLTRAIAGPNSPPPSLRSLPGGSPSAHCAGGILNGFPVSVTETAARPGCVSAVLQPHVAVRTSRSPNRGLHPAVVARSTLAGRRRHDGAKTHRGTGHKATTEYLDLAQTGFRNPVSLLQGLQLSLTELQTPFRLFPSPGPCLNYLIAEVPLRLKCRPSEL